MQAVRRVTIETIAPQDQRYDTIGDWGYDPATQTIWINVSDLGDWRMAIACALHELAEAALCVQDGVDETAVNEFDIEYEAARSVDGAAPCGCTPTDDSEPGEDEHAPYRKQHALADAIERAFALAIGIVWSKYSAAVEEASKAWYAAQRE